jgi:hypothetical protein
MLRELPGYSLCRYVCGWLKTPAGDVPQVTGKLHFLDIAGHWAMRWGFGRSHYCVTPGLYAIGNPTADSEVLISANYKLSFDVLRRAISGLDLWILVIDTKGINVWCAAGKGTFGTAEIVNRVAVTDLQKVVSHRRLIVPQLGAPGVAAHEVRKQCDFNVTYGPVRADDLKSFLAAGRQATPQMRRVTFGIRDRFILTPVEMTVFWKNILWSALVLFILGGIGPSFFSFSAAWSRGGSAILIGLIGLTTGAVLTPTLLPWITGRAFALKGAIAGVAVSTLLLLTTGPYSFFSGLATLFSLTAVASFAAMNFTGSSTYTSPSGVEKEMRFSIPLQIGALVLAGGIWIWTAF